MLTGNALLDRKVIRILPHIIDTLFLLSGITLLTFLGGTPLTQPWMLFKIAGLVIYIGLGMIALFALYRMTRRAALPLEEQGDFVLVSQQTTPIAATAIAVSGPRARRGATPGAG